MPGFAPGHPHAWLCARLHRKHWIPFFSLPHRCSIITLPHYIDSFCARPTHPSNRSGSPSHRTGTWSRSPACPHTALSGFCHYTQRPPPRPGIPSGYSGTFHRSHTPRYFRWAPSAMLSGSCRHTLAPSRPRPPSPASPPGSGCRICSQTPSPLPASPRFPASRFHCTYTYTHARRRPHSVSASRSCSRGALPSPYGRLPGSASPPCYNGRSASPRWPRWPLPDAPPHHSYSCPCSPPCPFSTAAARHCQTGIPARPLLHRGSPRALP